MEKISRRKMVAASAGVAGFTFLPGRALGRGGAIPPSEKLSIAFIGIGTRGSFDLRELSSQNVVALCDVDWRPIPNYRYPRACDIAPQYPQAKRYDDWRIMLQEQDKNIDAVVVATADHVHAVASVAAMKMGKHVYCEKPLSHSIHEVRAMMAAEKKYKVSTQLGNQGHSSEDCRMIVEWVRDGAIGDVKDVHLFLYTGAQGVGKPTDRTGVPYADIPKILAEDVPVPKGLHWDLWLGPAPARKFNEVYLPGMWRRWLDFGGGAMGDYNCHYLDPVMWALDLGYPEKVEANPESGYDPATNRQTFPNAAEIRWSFPARGKMPPVNVTWHYGLNSGTVPLPMGWKEGDKLPGAGGGVLYGSKGSIVFGPIYASLPLTASTGEYKPVTWGTPTKVVLCPEALDRSYKRPDKTLPRPFNHWMDWVEAAKARKPAGSNFAYGGVMTQIGHMGNIASRLKGQILYYDAKQGKFKNHDEANKMFQRPCREGWKLPG